MNANSYLEMPLILLMCIAALMTLSCATTQNAAPSNNEDSAKASPAVANPKIVRVTKDSVCRGYAVPADFDTRGCTVTGPYPGEIRGNTLSKEATLEEALAICVKNPECTGITASWYVGAQFSAASQKGAFAPQSDSYGCAFTVSDCKP